MQINIKSDNNRQRPRVKRAPNEIQPFYVRESVVCMHEVDANNERGNDAIYEVKHICSSLLWFTNQVIRNECFYGYIVCRAALTGREGERERESERHPRCILAHITSSQAIRGYFHEKNVAGSFRLFFFLFYSIKCVFQFINIQLAYEIAG